MRRIGEVRLQHVSVIVPAGRDAREQAIAFYSGLLGLEQRDVPPHLDPGAVIWFRAGGDLELHLIQEGAPAQDQRHLCLELEGGDLEALRARIEADGVETSDATPIVGRPRFFCRDPFGNLVELTRIDEAV
jgi:catechol 2,3-dioxygenase-like lactoylglutathione lyase family enzyme